MGGCGCGGRSKARSFGRDATAQAPAQVVTEYEIVIKGKAERFPTLLEARRYRNENGGTLRTVSVRT
jgi:hypothetical protein